ncbi:MAG TPA: RHS repeat-associated core domain-containing protein, partial [Anaerolineaceae bacterium]|nr:RHS repeat-associated core domain-containing protein [Anaerolineaceae bacterium]
ASVSLDAQVITKYYYAGGQRVAVRKDGELSYLLGDHLGSASVVADIDGGLLSETMYKPWGETRYSGGAVMPTDRLYTGQIAEPILGLYFYNARWYDSSLSRFSQADTIIPNPGDPQSWDRYAYVRNSPTGRIDPTGHMDDDGLETVPAGIGIAGLLDVDLVKHVSINQYMDAIYRQFGFNACGLVAGSYAGVFVHQLGSIAEDLNTSEKYTPEHGIQPGPLVKVYKEAYGNKNVHTCSGENFTTALNWMFMQLKAGNIVVVDILATLGDTYTWATSEAETTTFAHFARVLQINYDKQTITLDNTLGGSTSYWTLSFSEFEKSWNDPEVRADVNGPTRELIGYWAVSITPTDYPNKIFRLPE